MNCTASSFFVLIGIFLVVSAQKDAYGQVKADNVICVKNADDCPNSYKNKDAEIFTEIFQDIEITGDQEFVQKTKEALGLLENVQEFQDVKCYLGAIQMAEYSEMNVYQKIPTYEVGNRTYQSSVCWYASTIAHDTYHSFLYFQGKERLNGEEPASDIWTGKEAEIKCLIFQLELYKKILSDSDIPTIEYLEKLIACPTYQDTDYKDRDW